ncbi:MAG: polysaccharide pyruvyl transferase family protein, partial [Pseudomonadota bacterium]
HPHAAQLDARRHPINAGSWQHADGIELINAALKIDSTKPGFYFNRALCFQALDELESAASSYQQAISLDDSYLAAYENLGVVRRDQGKSTLAIEQFRKALGLNPNSELALRNLATVLLNLNRDEEAFAVLDQLLTLNPFDANGHLKLSQIQMRAEDFAAAWDSYEWRFYASDYLDHNSLQTVSLAHYVYEPGTHTSVLVTAEQGLGDEIMFASCADDLSGNVSQVHWQCDARLLPLFKRSMPAISFLSSKQALDLNDLELDAKVAAGSLPRLYRRDLTQFPGKAYLIACPDRQAEMVSTLGQFPGRLKIGLSWQGGLDARSKRARSIALDEFAALVDDGHTLVDLQYGDHDEALQAFNADGERLHRLPGLDLTQDIDGVAALVSALDLVVTIDNSLAHLAGALGVPVYLLLPSASERRWLRKRSDSVWYSRMTLFRQAESADSWCDLIRSVRSAIDTEAPRDCDSTTRKVVQTETNGISPSKSAFLLNDTSNWYHWGCSATSLGLAKLIRARGYALDSLAINQTPLAPPLVELSAWDDRQHLQDFRNSNTYLIDRLSKADKIVVNGEGTLHGLSQGAQNLLFLARFCARDLGKSVHIVNHSCYPDEGSTGLALYKEVYHWMDSVAVREPFSHRLSAQNNKAAELSFDCLPLFLQTYPQLIEGPTSDYVVIAGSAAYGEAAIGPLAAAVNRLSRSGVRSVFLFGASAYVAADELQFGRLLVHACENTLELVHARSEYEWLRVIAGSSALLSGRFHHTIAAAFTRTPFLVTPSNSKKNQGLTEMLDLPDTFLSNQHEFEVALLERLPELVRQPESALLSAERRSQLMELATLNAGQL